MSNKNLLFATITGLGLSLIACTEPADPYRAITVTGDAGAGDTERPRETLHHQEYRAPAEPSRPADKAPAAQPHEHTRGATTASAEFVAHEPAPVAPVMRVTDETGLISWEPPDANSFASIEVIVVDQNDRRIRKRFGAGESIALTDPLPDGVYSWETRSRPQVEPWVMEQLREVRESGDLEAQRALMQQFRADGQFPSEQQIAANVRSGTFRIRNGVLVTTEERE